MTTSSTGPRAFDLGDFDQVRQHLDAQADADRLVRCEISRVVLGRGALEQVPEVLAGVLAAAGSTTARPRVALLHDATPIYRGGDLVKPAVAELLAEQFEVTTTVLQDAHPVLHADEHSIGMAELAAQGCDAVVTVGGGTVTDIGKLAAMAAGDLPHVVVQTVASVDGFTDNVSVILRSGVKRTVPSRWPDAVVADTQTISQAPAAMNRAGFGEITSMFTAPADWYLASLVGQDLSFHQGPIDLLGAVGADIDDWSAGVARADADAVEHLTWALAVRGVATGISGGTACLSGVEHLVSHMLDLHHGQQGLPIGLHGAQVGVAAVLSAAAWELLFDRMAARSSRGDSPALSTPDAEEARARVDAAFAHLDDTGAIAAECWRDYGKKLDRWTAELDRTRALLSDWDSAEPTLRSLVRGSADIARALAAAGSPVSFDQLDPGITAELGRWALANCALMRNRFTVTDLLTFLGWWTDADVDEVLARAARAADSTTRSTAARGNR